MHEKSGFEQKRWRPTGQQMDETFYRYSEDVGDAAEMNSIQFFAKPWCQLMNEKCYAFKPYQEILNEGHGTLGQSQWRMKGRVSASCYCTVRGLYLILNEWNLV